MNPLTQSNPPSEKKIQALFDKIAPKYDFLNRVLSMRQDVRWRNRMIDFLPKTKNARLLDVATGTGDVALWTAQKKANFQEIEGIDISDMMLERARLKCSAVSNPKMTFKNMSASRLDEYKDESFDALTISFGLRNVTDKPQALKEFFRVLKPTGRLLVLEFFEPQQEYISKAYKFYFKKILPRIGQVMSDKAAYEYLPASVENFYSPKDFKSLCQDHGFTLSERESFLWGSCQLWVFDKSAVYSTPFEQKKDAVH